MPYPDKPQILTSYTAQEQALGDGSLPGQELDVDLASLSASVEETIDFLKTSLRSDGKLANGSVTSDSLSASLRIGFEPPEPWVTATEYTTVNTVFEGFGFYLCTIAHTAGVFATDLASGRWQLLADLTPPGGALIASNNLSDLTDNAQARDELGLGTMATATAGTGSTQFRTNAQNEAAFQPIITGLTSSAAELNILDGVTATTAELNILDGVTASTAELNLLDGVTSTTAELNILDGVTATATEINLLDGLTAVQTTITDSDTALPTSGAVLDQLGWRPYNGTTGVLYSVSVSGATAAVEAIFEDGYEYLLIGENYSMSATGRPRARLYRATGAAYTAHANIYGSDLTAASFFYTEIYCYTPSLVKSAHVFPSLTYGQSGATIADTFASLAPAGAGVDYISITHATPQKIGRLEISPTSGNFDAGTFYLFRRRLVQL